jgi:hypothetical protein
VSLSMFSLYETFILSLLLPMAISISYSVYFCKQFFITFFHAYCKNHHVFSFPFPFRLSHSTLSQISKKYFPVFLSNSETNLLLVISIVIPVLHFMHQIIVHDVTSQDTALISSCFLLSSFLIHVVHLKEFVLGESWSEYKINLGGSHYHSEGS